MNWLSCLIVLSYPQKCMPIWFHVRFYIEIDYVENIVHCRYSRRKAKTKCCIIRLHSDHITLYSQSKSFPLRLHGRIYFQRFVWHCQNMLYSLFLYSSSPSHPESVRKHWLNPIHYLFRKGFVTFAGLYLNNLNVMY